MFFSYIAGCFSCYNQTTAISRTDVDSGFRCLLLMTPLDLQVLNNHNKRINLQCMNYIVTCSLPIHCVYRPPISPTTMKINFFVAQMCAKTAFVFLSMGGEMMICYCSRTGYILGGVSSLVLKSSLTRFQIHNKPKSCGFLRQCGFKFK